MTTVNSDNIIQLNSLELQFTEFYLWKCYLEIIVKCFTCIKQIKQFIHFIVNAI